MYNGHLSIEEIEQLSQQKGPAENQTHVENCQQCKSLLAKYQIVSAKLDQLASARIGAKNGMNCPEEKVWFDVAGGTLPEAESFTHIQHAAECESCGKKLRNATRLFDEKLSPEEEKILSALPSTGAKAQSKLAERLASSGRGADVQQAKKKAIKFFALPFGRPQPWMAVAAVVIAAFVGFQAYRINEIGKIQTKIANQYKKGRPTEYRVAGVDFSRLTATMGGVERFYVRVPDWLQRPTLSAQAAFLEREWDAAIRILEKARQSGNNSVEVLDNLVVAYALEGERAQDRDFYAKALLLSDEIIQQYPSDAIVYFNRALLFEQLGRRQDAIVSLRKFIEMEPDGPSRDEAKEKLQMLL